jgi:hypothetical protein
MEPGSLTLFWTAAAIASLPVSTLERVPRRKAGKKGEKEVIDKLKGWKIKCPVDQDGRESRGII